MLHEGQVYYDGPIEAFDNMAAKYYQIDITLVGGPNSASGETPIEALVEGIRERVDGDKSTAIARIIVYSENLVRLTISKSRIPFSRLWGFLRDSRSAAFGCSQIVEKFSFRLMSTEDLLSNMIAELSCC